MKKYSDNHYLKDELYELVRNDPKIFDFLQEGSTDGMWYWDLDNPENEWMNSRFWTTLGYDPEEMPHLASAWQDIIDPDDLKLAIENFEKHCADPSHPYDQTVRYKHKAGSTVWIRCRGIAIRDESGKPLRMLGVHTDVTEVRKSLSRLNRNKYLESMIESGPCGMVVVDRTGEILMVNKRMEELFGWGSEELIGETVELLLPEALRQAHAALRSGYVKNPHSRAMGLGQELQGRRKDGSLFYVEVGLSSHQSDDEFYVIASVVDVSLRRETEQRVRELAAIVEDSGDAIIGAALDGTVTAWNTAAENLYGYSSKEMIGRKLSRLLLDGYPDDFQVLVEGIESTGSIEKYETSRRHKDGTTLEISETVSPITNSKGDLVAISTIARDVTESRKAARERAMFTRLLEKSNDELERFAYVVSHDLKAPLRGIRSLTQWMQEDFHDKLGEDGIARLGQLSGAAQRMTSLIDGILEYSKISRKSETPTRVDLEKVIHNARLLADPQRVLQVDVVGALPEIEGGQTRLQQLFQNLFSNCVNHIARKDKRVTVSCEELADYWEFRVSDNGDGVDPKHSAKIFELFQTLGTKKTYDHTGVGLALVKKIVEMHGGGIHLDHNYRAGCCFIFTLAKVPDWTTA